jgi:hypothetical protein
MLRIARVIEECHPLFFLSPFPFKERGIKGVR